MVLQQRGDDPDVMNDVTFAALVGTIVGAQGLLRGARGQCERAVEPRRLRVLGRLHRRRGALRALVIRWRKQHFLRIADGAAVGIAAGYAIGRTGCWAVGDDYGRVWDGSLAVAFPQGLPPTTVSGDERRVHHANLPASLPPDTVVSVYPTQLLEVVLGFVMFVVLWRLRHHAHAAGWLFGMYCVLAGVERFVVEFFRAKSDMIGPVTSAQCVALARRGGRRPAAHHAPSAAPALAVGSLTSHSLSHT